MSDRPAKRGRKAAATVVEAALPVKSESPKKRGRSEAAKPIVDEAPVPAKRGRGRPKKKVYLGRGRPKKVVSEEVENDNEASDE